jgi:hypothetical protein
MASKLVRKPKKRNILTYSSIGKAAGKTNSNSKKSKPSPNKATSPSKNLSYSSSHGNRKSHAGSEMVPSFQFNQKGMFYKERSTIGRELSIEFKTNRDHKKSENPLFAKKKFYTESKHTHNKDSNSFRSGSNNSSFKKESFRSPETNLKTSTFQENSNILKQANLASTNDATASRSNQSTVMSERVKQLTREISEYK